MPTRDSYAQGTPNWVDLQTTDQAAAKEFYSGLFGWTYDAQPMPAGGAASSVEVRGGKGKGGGRRGRDAGVRHHGRGEDGVRDGPGRRRGRALAGQPAHRRHA